MIHDAVRAEAGVAVQAGLVQARREAVDDEAGDRQIPAFVEHFAVFGPGVETAGQVGYWPGFLEHAGVEVAGTVVGGGEVVVFCGGASHVVHGHRRALVQYRADAPHQGDFTACGVIPSERDPLIKPGGTVVVADVENEELTIIEVDFSVFVEVFVLGEFTFGGPSLGISFSQGEVLIEGRVGHRTEAEGVGVDVAVVGADDTGEFPFGVNRVVFTAGPFVFGVFERPGGEPADVDHAVLAVPAWSYALLSNALSVSRSVPSFWSGSSMGISSAHTSRSKKKALLATKKSWLVSVW